MSLPTPALVSDGESLSLCIERCLASDAIAVDTEFMRTDTFYPKLGLIQLSDGENVWLLDPLTISDFGPLKKLFTDADTVKIFHSCSEDLEVIWQQFELVPYPLFDTQIAAAFLGYGFSRGYSVIVEETLDIQLGKHETRSDWLSRPLSASQKQYAAEDVFFLIKAYRKLQASLEQRGRDQWMAEEMTELVEQSGDTNDPESYYLRVKGAWKLDPEDLARLRALTAWREREARRRDRPRNRIVSDKTLLELLRFKPRTLNGLYSIDGFHNGLIRRYGEKLMEIIQQPPDIADLESLPAALDKEGRSLLSHCRQKMEARAEQLGIAPEIMARKKDLEPLVRSALRGEPSLPPRLATGWRFTLFGQELYDYVAS